MDELAESESRRPTLRRGIGTTAFFALAFGSMIGVGWVTALGSWLEQAGPFGAMLAFAAGGALMITVGLCYAELTSMLPVAGGEVAYAYRASGTTKAFVVGWFLAFGYLSVSAFEAISVGHVLAYLVPGVEVWPLYELGGATIHGSNLVLACVFTGTITWVNYRGARGAARLQLLLTAAFVVTAVVFIVLGLASGELKHAEPFFPGSAGDGAGSWGGAAAVFVTVPFWFVGFDTIPQGAEEANANVSPRRLGVLILASIACATLFYIVLVASVVVTGPWQELIDVPLPTATAFGRVFASPWLVDLVLVAALLGLFTSWNGFFLAGSRVLFALGRARIVAPVLGRAHPRFGTPFVAVLVSGVVTALGAALGHGAMLGFVNVGSFCIAIAFLGVTQALLRLRRDAPDLPRPCRIPAGVAVARVAMFGSLLVVLAMVVPTSPAALGALEWKILAGFAVVGAASWTIGATRRRTTPESERAALILGELACPARRDGEESSTEARPEDERPEV